MSKTGISRKIDPLGRIVIPKEMRDLLGLDVGVSVEMEYRDGGVFIERYKDYCVLCNSQEDVTEVLGKKVCEKCLRALKKL